MSFDFILREIVRECPGCRGAALMGPDGIPIAEVAKHGEGDETSLLGVEMGRVLDEARKAASTVGGGGLDELLVGMSHLHVVVRAVDAETFLVLALAPDGNIGKARYLLRRHLAALREQL